MQSFYGDFYYFKLVNVVFFHLVILQLFWVLCKSYKKRFYFKHFQHIYLATYNFKNFLMYMLFLKNDVYIYIHTYVYVY